MSGGKKRSGFQITSVTSDYNQGSGENNLTELLSPGSQRATPTSARGPAHGRSPRSQTASPTQILSNGPLLRHSSAFQTQQSSSQPSTPVTTRKQNSLDSSGASRFRVVRLDQGPGEPYKRGRWTCVDVIEREVEERGLRRVIDSMRHAHSLESLETVGLGGGGVEGAVGGARLKPLGVHTGHMVHSQGTLYLLSQCRTDSAHSGLPSPSHDSQPITSPHLPNTPRIRNIPAPLRLDMDAVGKLRTTRSQAGFSWATPGSGQSLPFRTHAHPDAVPPLRWRRSHVRHGASVRARGRRRYAACVRVCRWVECGMLGAVWAGTESQHIHSVLEIGEMTGQTGGLSPQITLIPGFGLDWASLTDYSTMDGGLTQTENPILLDGSSADSKPHPSCLSPAHSTVICRPRLHAGETNVTGGARRVRDSWPIGKLDYYPRAGCLALSAETKQPISSKRFPHTSSRNKPGRNSTSKPSISSTETDTAPPAGHSQTQRSGNNPRSVRFGSSCQSSVRDQICQNPEWDSLTSIVREKRGGALTHKHRLRPSDSTLLSLLLFLHSGTNSSMIAIDNKIEQAMDLVKSHLMLAVREEVEVLREQIKELAERNAQLERENYILRALRDRD
ncbi:uncharacterized protein zgc:153012 [Rhinichthys klamathensis goyatoka]|uniref:uncharacterized protein zgc:153012 n=1 Tax=Rhinichthys klamathensis goyatoka TaxID=3034132 RepID=UPI0024B52723|nr:uncharacterized protein zgc:153012 [Rhinichthys klamathensis goyatoka]